MKRALISLSDKTGILELANELDKLGYEIISTGGTAETLKQGGISVTGVSDITGFPECLDGRVKTLHPAIHGGLLARRDLPLHMNQIDELNIKPIDLLVVNLYPFKATIEKDNVLFEDAIENIDIGGPAMLRSAAKNFKDVLVVTDPSDYTLLIDQLKKGVVSEETRLYFALKVFEHTSAYDSMIAAYLKSKSGSVGFSNQLTLTFEKAQEMRYGENPHQMACFYKDPIPETGSLALFEQLHGKELSFNNINDANGAIELLSEYDEPTIIAVKHANPCGVGSAETIFEAYMKAYNSDKTSIFGGIVASNREIDKNTATEMNKIFLEIIIAPSFSKEALDILTAKQNIRLLTLDLGSKNSRKSLFDFDIKRVSGGILVQERNLSLVPEELNFVTNRKPSQEELNDLLFTWKMVKHVKSNAIAIGKNKQSVGIGPGQVNRIWACIQAIEHGKDHLGDEYLKGAVMASDAYFPFPDCATEAAKAGITAIICPGGSKNDQLSIDVCNANNIAMVFTGMRHFKH